MKTNSLVLVLTLAAVAVVGSGCAVLVVGGAAAAGAGTVAYIKGELRSVEGVTLDRAYDATLAAMKDLEFAVTDKQKDALSAKLTVRGAGDRKIKITLDKQAGATTEIRIRVGTFGDEKLSHQVLAAIQKRL